MTSLTWLNFPNKQSHWILDSPFTSAITDCNCVFVWLWTFVYIFHECTEYVHSSPSVIQVLGSSWHIVTQIFVKWIYEWMNKWSTTKILKFWFVKFSHHLVSVLDLEVIAHKKTVKYLLILCRFILNFIIDYFTLYSLFFSSCFPFYFWTWNYNLYLEIKI